MKYLQKVLPILILSILPIININAKDLTRGEMAEIIDKNFSITPNPVPHSYPDLNSNDPYFKEINNLQYNNLIKTYPDGYIRTQAQVQKLEAARLITDLLQLSKSENNTPYFTDVPKEQWYFPFVQTIAENNIIPKGGNFKPQENISEEEFIQWLNIKENAGKNLPLKVDNTPKKLPLHVEIRDRIGVLKTGEQIRFTTSLNSLGSEFIDIDARFYEANGVTWEVKKGEDMLYYNGNDTFTLNAPNQAGTYIFQIKATYKNQTTENLVQFQVIERTLAQPQTNAIDQITFDIHIEDEIPVIKPNEKIQFSTNLKATSTQNTQDYLILRENDGVIWKVVSGTKYAKYQNNDIFTIEAPNKEGTFSVKIRANFGEKTKTKDLQFQVVGKTIIKKSLSGPSIKYTYPETQKIKQNYTNTNTIPVDCLNNIKCRTLVLSRTNAKSIQVTPTQHRQQQYTPARKSHTQKKVNQQRSVYCPDLKCQQQMKARNIPFHTQVGQEFTTYKNHQNNYKKKEPAAAPTPVHKITPPKLVTPAGFTQNTRQNYRNTYTNKQDTGVEYEYEINTNATNYFSDVNTYNLEGRAANFLRNKKIIGGFPDGEFKGNRDVNRAEASKFLLLAGNYNVPESNQIQNSTFEDIAGDEWFAKYVITAKKENIINGYPDNKFRPGHTVNTAEFLKMLSKALNTEKNIPHDYTDVKTNDWFNIYAGLAKKYDLFPENKTKKLNPAKNLTRKEVAIAIYQYLKNK